MKTLVEFEAFLQKLRVEKGWVVTLEHPSIWLATVHDKETGKLLGETGATSLEALVWFMESVPIDQWGSATGEEASCKRKGRRNG